MTASSVPSRCACFVPLAAMKCLRPLMAARRWRFCSRWGRWTSPSATCRWRAWMAWRSCVGRASRGRSGRCCSAVPCRRTCGVRRNRSLPCWGCSCWVTLASRCRPKSCKPCWISTGAVASGRLRQTQWCSPRARTKCVRPWPCSNCRPGISPSSTCAAVRCAVLKCFAAGCTPARACCRLRCLSRSSSVAG